MLFVAATIAALMLMPICVFFNTTGCVVSPLPGPPANQQYKTVGAYTEYQMNVSTTIRDLTNPEADDMGSQTQSVNYTTRTTKVDGDRSTVALEITGASMNGEKLIEVPENETTPLVYSLDINNTNEQILNVSKPLPSNNSDWDGRVDNLARQAAQHSFQNVDPNQFYNDTSTLEETPEEPVNMNREFDCTDECRTTAHYERGEIEEGNLDISMNRSETFNMTQTRNASNGHLTDSAIVSNVASKNEHVGNDSTAVLTHMTFEMRSTAHPIASGINISAANETVKKIGSTNREEMVVVKPNVHTNEKEDYLDFEAPHDESSFGKLADFGNATNYTAVNQTVDIDRIRKRNLKQGRNLCRPRPPKKKFLAWYSCTGFNCNARVTLAKTNILSKPIELAVFGNAGLQCPSKDQFKYSMALKNQIGKPTLIYERLYNGKDGTVFGKMCIALCS